MEKIGCPGLSKRQFFEAWLYQLMKGEIPMNEFGMQYGLVLLVIFLDYNWLLLKCVVCVIK